MTERRVEYLDEPQLIERARQGDRVAFGVLVSNYQHEVFTLATRLVKDHALAADVAQEAFIRAFRSIAGFRGDAALSSWLYRITVNTAWTHLGRAERRRAVPVEAVPDVADRAPERDPVLAAEALTLRHRIGEAVAELPDNQRIVVVLKDVYGWSHAEIAEALSLTVTATKVRLHRAHQKLRAALREPS